MPTLGATGQTGLTRFEDARLAVEAGADYLGFIFYPPSPRAITPDAAADLIVLRPVFCGKLTGVESNRYVSNTYGADPATLTNVTIHDGTIDVTGGEGFQFLDADGTYLFTGTTTIQLRSRLRRTVDQSVHMSAEPTPARGLRKLV